MTSLHSPTLVAVAAILMFIMTLMLLAAWRMNPRIAGLKAWTLAFACGLPICLNLLLRDYAPEWLSVVFTQLSTFLLAWLNLAACRRYLNLRRLPHSAGLCTVAMLLLSGLYFTLVQPNQGLRFLTLSTVLGLLFLLSARTMARGGIAHYPARYLYALCCGSHGVFLLLRPWLFHIGNKGLFDSAQMLVVSHLVVIEAIVALVLLGFCVVMLANEQVTLALKQMADRDPLTGAYNRRAFMSMLEKATLYAHRLAFPVSVLLIDLDHFKRINDTWGHQRGDDALRHVVQVAQDCLREGDILGRMGGEEFAIMLPNATQQEAEHIAGRLRQAIEAQPLQYAGATLSLTTSIGVAGWLAPENPDGLLHRADEAMYQAKRQGRNCVVLAPQAV
ncbi:GGDEF domain-containing protein [Vogesella sp. DC21W]|uniref:diguanylate cyclase n=1 Tax=Vogesella aquatica TaxID=2984206 RepID=A0ABT5IY83_9NEIS|nr:GGDEF domain-containing protein [Vogesella aquatica]MDC7717539.1 GGDEF domain-containing protein [Vogesella aquatica]